MSRNWRCAAGEIDVIACKPGVLVICEVKARASNAFGSGAEAVTVTKQRRLRRLAAQWMAADGRRWTDIRFDVAVVTAGKLEIIEAAF